MTFAAPRACLKIKAVMRLKDKVLKIRRGLVEDDQVSMGSKEFRMAKRTLTMDDYW